MKLHIIDNALGRFTFTTESARALCVELTDADREHIAKMKPGARFYSASNPERYPGEAVQKWLEDLAAADPSLRELFDYAEGTRDPEGYSKLLRAIISRLEEKP